MGNDRLTVGLALGGGGARGLAHVGVLKVLVREGIPVDVISGASFGSIIGALYALNPDMERLFADVERVLSSERFHKAKVNFLRHEFEEERRMGVISNIKSFFRQQFFYSVAFRLRQLVSEEEFTAIIDDLLPDVRFEDTRIPFTCVATDISHGTEMVFDEGPLRPAVYGSASIPGVFPPIHHRGRYLVDGGWVDRVPVGAARALGADVVIGVDISEDLGREPVEKLKNGLELLIRANNVTGRMLCDIQLKDADVLVRPKVGHLHWAAFDKAAFCIREGEAAMEAALPQVREKCFHRRNRGWRAAFRARKGKPREPANQP